MRYICGLLGLADLPISRKRSKTAGGCALSDAEHQHRLPEELARMANSWTVQVGDDADVKAKVIDKEDAGTDRPLATVQPDSPATQLSAPGSRGPGETRTSTGTRSSRAILRSVSRSMTSLNVISSAVVSPWARANSRDAGRLPTYRSKLIVPAEIEGTAAAETFECNTIFGVARSVDCSAAFDRVRQVTAYADRPCRSHWPLSSPDRAAPRTG